MTPGWEGRFVSLKWRDHGKKEDAVSIEEPGKDLFTVS